MTILKRAARPKRWVVRLNRKTDSGKEVLEAIRASRWRLRTPIFPN
jgi:hypothetical protein